jgi:ribosomal protein S18 acetylase RimI-like enzyme
MADPTFTVRIAESRDEADVARVLEAAFTRLVGIHPSDLFASGGGTDRWILPEVLTSGRYYVAETADGIIACGGWSLDVPGRDERHPGTGYMRDCATHPAYLRCGAAGAVVARALADARALGLTEMRCVSPVSAAAFYVAQGFAQEDRTMIRMPNGTPTMVAVLSCRLEATDG